ncbi:MAG: PanM family protein [Candidatus Obscuribacterales bacterium]|nr:PanM family protein [Candidatus Obscuribacterales bacterium]
MGRQLDEEIHCTVPNNSSSWQLAHLCAGSVTRKKGVGQFRLYELCLQLSHVYGHENKFKKNTCSQTGFAR